MFHDNLQEKLPLVNNLYVNFYWSTWIDCWIDDLSTVIPGNLSRDWFAIESNLFYADS